MTSTMRQSTTGRDRRTGSSEPGTAGRSSSRVAAPGRSPLRRRGGTPATVRGRRVTREAAARPSAAELARRVPFVVVVLVLIATGVGGTLWLSAQSTQETYDLKNARDANVRLVERKESLQTSNERARSAEVLAARAEKQGMVAVDTAPILVRGEDGHIDVVGGPDATLGAPIQPLQKAPVPSDQPASPVQGVAGDQQSQNRSAGASPVPYPPNAGTPAQAPQASAPVPLTAPPGGDQAGLAPVPGQAR